MCAHSDELAGGVRGDVLALCVDFEGSSDKEGFAAAAARLRSEGMRMLMVHRLRETVPESMLRQGIEYVPRDGLRPRAPRGQEVVDVCFVLDLTASMGHIIDACKAHVAAIIRGLLSELEVGELRVAFVGYRDWGERNNAAHPRVVALPFVGHAGAEALAERIGRESAYGGADMAEDVLSGMEAARDLEWRGDVRVCLFIADAPAHGWTGWAATPARRRRHRRASPPSGSLHARAVVHHPASLCDATTPPALCPVSGTTARTRLTTSRTAAAPTRGGSPFRAWCFSSPTTRAST